MTRHKLIASVCALAAPLMLATAVLAQGQPQSQPAPSGAAGGPPPGSVSPENRPYPVLIVTSVELLRSTHGGGMDIIRARGLATSGGWGDPHLLPISNGPRPDGVLDLILQARASDNAAGVGPFMPVEALLPVMNGHPYKSVRVRSANNAITLKTLPGFVEAAPPKEDCAKCVGKFFQAKGAAAPAGVAAGDIVREEDLPYRLRVIKPTDGIPHYDLDPNRLTLVLGEDNKIVDAAWD